MNLEDLGYTPFFEENKNLLGFSSCKAARVTSELKGAYRIKDENGEYLAKVTGKQMFDAASREDFPAVGDWVVIDEPNNDSAVIRGILPRASIIKRKYGDKIQVIAANLDVAFIVEAVDRDYNLNRFERYFSLALSGGVTPAIILNKIDLLSDEEIKQRKAELEERFPGTDIILVSAANNEGLVGLKNYIAKGKTYCFLGSSGVGKSSIINKLLGEEAIKTGDISSYSGRGKHVTTNRQMYFLKNGAIVIDNPGIRQVGVADAESGMQNVFGEIFTLAENCKYVDCGHIQEPGCAVLHAVETGELSREKYSNYINLKKEADFSEMNQIQKKEKDRKFGKFVKKVKKELKDSGRKDW